MGILEIYFREKALFDCGIEGSLTLGIFGPCLIVENVGTLTYRLDLPLGLVSVHNVSHLSIHRMYIPYPSHVLLEQSFTLRDVLTHVEPVQIWIDVIIILEFWSFPMAKVLWRNLLAEEATLQPCVC